MLLTCKTGSAPPPPSGSFEETHLIREGWKQVQGLADMFWNMWKREYLKTLQLRHKWQGKRPNLQEGDIVLLKDNQAKRNQWPTGLITKTFPGEDGLVWKVSSGNCQGWNQKDLFSACYRSDFASFSKD